MAEPAVDFATRVIRRSHELPVLVDFWAPWCAPCRALGPILERVAADHEGRLELVKVNTEERPDLASRYDIRSIPNVKLFVDGKVADGFTGALPEGLIRDWLARVLPSPLRQQIQTAREHLAEGRRESAERLLEAVLAAEPDNEEAAALWALAALFRDPKAAAERVQRISLGSEQGDLAEAVRVLARLLLLAQTPERLPDGKVRAPYLQAIEALRSGDFAAALAGFVEVVKQDRRYDEDGARSACVALFRYLGGDHPLTREYRPLLSSALYA